MTSAIQEQLVGVLVMVLAAAAPLVRTWVQSKLTPERLAHVVSLARIGVQAAEKLGESMPGTTNEAKLNFAAETVVAGAKRLGLKLTKDEVLAYVHAALREMQQVEAVAHA